MMYTEGTDNYNVYYATFETLTETETGTNVFSSSDCDTFENVSVDSSNNIYISYANNNHFIKKITCTVQDGKYQYDNGTTYRVVPSVVSHSVYSIGIIKQVNEKLYMFDTDSSSINHLLKGTYDSQILSVTEIVYTNGFDNVMSFCVSDDETKVYTYEFDDNSNYWLKSYTITSDSDNNASNLYSEKTLLLVSSDGNNGLFSTKYKCPYVTINDMFFNNNSIYLLIGDYCSTHSRGGILKLDSSNITTTETQFSYCFSPESSVSSENGLQYFYYPQKIVGVGEDFILILDTITTNTQRIVKYSLPNNSILEAKQIKY